MPGIKAIFMLRFILYTYIPVIITDPYTHSRSEHSLQKGLWVFDIKTCYVGFLSVHLPLVEAL